ncbi:SPOR domain-containing protein [Rhodosalinus sediminis]|uniref:SPOR domain-containing protein n=1 Tax=Rhodosalinus sediminis TaxID=1940533 RepID=UPI002356841C|nr:SPOR domain-containing protein [Rhodosalinus sediminis]
MRHGGTGRVALLGAALVLGGCGETGGLPFLGGERTAEAEAPSEAGSVRLVERDVEAPEVFQVTASGLWDGRPSLGGVWVAHPDVEEPERVIIRDTGSEKFVIGALFRREREVPGPPLQVSSDAAEALGLLAGQPRELEVTALRREEVSEAPEDDAAEDQATEAALPEAAEVSAAPLDPVAAAEEALEAGDDAAAGDDTPSADDAASETAEPATPPRSAPERPYVQIGIFSVEQNARNTATAMRQAGMVPTVRKQETQGKTFWRVLVGPAPNRRDLEALLDTAREQGFADAYAVRD